VEVSDIILTYLDSLGFTPDDVKVEQYDSNNFIYKIPGFFFYQNEFDLLTIDKGEFGLVVRMFDSPYIAYEVFRNYIGGLIGRDLSLSKIYTAPLAKK
jgi:hypothetical protein